MVGESWTMKVLTLAFSVWINAGLTTSLLPPSLWSKTSALSSFSIFTADVLSKSEDFQTLDSEISVNARADTNVKTPVEIPGKNKWLGGAVDQEGRIYGVPSNAQEVICLAPNPDDEKGGYEMHTIPLPPSISQGQFKWLRGIIWDRYLIGIPAWSQDGVLWVDIASYWEEELKQKQRNNNSAEENSEEDEDDYKIPSQQKMFASVLPLPEGSLESLEEGMDAPERWLWHGAAMNKNQTAIYAIPSNAQQVLKIDLLTKRTSLLPIPVTVTPLSQTNKWYGGILGDDNAIYGVPYAASGILRIDADTDTVELIGEEIFGVREYNWHGGIKHPKNGKIYCFPAHNSHVLTIDTAFSKSNPGSSEKQWSLLDIQRASYDKDQVTRYKWLGGSLGADGNIYGMPSDASSILRIDTESDDVTTFGRVSEEKNKYQGGTLAADGFIYAIPSNSNNILCIDSNKRVKNEAHDGDRNAAFTIGDIRCTKNKIKDKWQGGFVGNDGAIYCIPENFNNIMKVIPKKESSTIEFM